MVALLSALCVFWIGESVGPCQRTDDHRNVYVDPGSGRVLGEGAPTRGVLGFVMNPHDCALSCEGYAG